MSYSSFTLQTAVAEFGLTLTTREPLFPHVPPVDPGPTVRHTLEHYGQLALTINSEKARSEWLIAPLFGELWTRARHNICVLSGVEFVVDRASGLSGVVDFLIGKGPQVSYITAPVLAVVEAKNESIPGGQGQCAAEMVAAQRFNRQTRAEIDTVYGAVTVGDNWRFHRLRGQEFAIDTREYMIAEADHIMGILLHIVGMNP